MCSTRRQACAVIDHGAYRPVYRQLADIIRGQITTGELQEGQLLPAEPRIADQYGVGRDTVRDALALLRSEGLVTTIRRVGTRVRPRPRRETIEIHPPDTVTARMPTEQEQREFDIPEGVPLFVVTRADGGEEILPADRYRLQAQ